MMIVQGQGRQSAQPDLPAKAQIKSQDAKFVNAAPSNPAAANDRKKNSFDLVSVNDSQFCNSNKGVDDNKNNAGKHLDSFSAALQHARLAVVPDQIINNFGQPGEAP